MNIVGTPYSDVHRSCWTASSVAFGSKPGPGMTIVAPLVVRPEVAHHHAEAVVEGHRDADAVVGAVAAQPSDEVAVVEDVVVRQRRALGEAGRARRVLDVDRVVRRQLGLQPGELRPVAALARLDERVPVRRAEQHHLAQRGAVRPHLLDHRRVVGGLEARRRDQHRDPGLVEHVLQLVRAVGRVDVDEDDADLRRGVLHERPLRDVGRPDPHPVALLDARGEQAERHGLDVLAHLRVGPAAPAGHVDHRLVVGLGRGDAVEVVADGVAEQRDVGGARACRTGRRGRQRQRHWTRRGLSRLSCRTSCDDRGAPPPPPVRVGGRRKPLATAPIPWGDARPPRPARPRHRRRPQAGPPGLRAGRVRPGQAALAGATRRSSAATRRARRPSGWPSRSRARAPTSGPRWSSAPAS